MAALGVVWDLIAADSATKLADLQVVLVSVDPARDTEEVLADYVTKFNPAFIGLRGDMDKVNALAKPLGIYQKHVHDAAHAGHYDVKHSPAVLLVGPGGNVRKLFTPPLDPDAMAAALKTLQVGR